MLNKNFKTIGQNKKDVEIIVSPFLAPTENHLNQSTTIMHHIDTFCPT